MLSSSNLRRAALLATVALASMAAAALPYIPTTVLLSSSAAGLSASGSGDDGIAYIFAPNGRSVDLLSVNISSTLSASSFEPQTLASDLPFLGKSDRVAFIPSILDNGILAVFAGDCGVATDAALWTYTPGGGAGSSAWARHETTHSNTWDYGQGGPYFLGGSLSFSAQLAPVVSDPILYVYGGMCPFSNTTGAPGGQQSSATYSNRMLKLSPPITRDAATSYAVSYAPTAGPPIAEAGFTFTELSPSISNRSGIVTKQTSHVLLGGHTQQAFINMSTAAIWSLPEETWSFVSIAVPEDVANGKTDLLAAKDTNSVLAAATASSIDSRSGHTAVLSEDGTSLVILGGWVGDTKQAAEPQLAVINIGAALSDWNWMIPAAQPPGPGFYGHGASLLPGNVMMVYGGYEISAGNSKLRRASGAQMFFNITSLTWADTYTNPTSASQHGTAPSPGSPSSPGSTGSDSDGNSPSSSSSDNKQLSLGLGLGLGIPLLLAAICMGLCLYRRRSRRRARRDEAIRGLTQGMAGGAGALPSHHNDGGEMLERDGTFFPWNADAARDWYTGGHDPYVQGRRSLGYESLRGGSGSRGGGGGFAPLPPPLARPRGAARGLYQPSTGLGDFHPLRIPMKNEIHPIYEDDEEEERADAPLSPTREECEEEDDPFATPTNTNTPTTALFPPPASASSESNRGSSPDRHVQAQGQDAEVQGWVSDVDAADAVLTAKIGRHGSTTTTPPRFQGQSNGQLHPQSAAGRVSPQRRNSNRSTVPGSESDEARTGSNLSERSTFSFVAGSERNVSIRPVNSSVTQHLRTGQAPASGEARLGTSGSSSGASFSTAKSTFAALQAEGPGLLIPAGAEDEPEDDYIDVPGSPSKSKPRRSWLGSLKRVFSGGTPSSGSDGSRADSPTREGLLDGGSLDYEPRLVGMGPNGTLLTRRKQGREAWDGDLGTRGHGDDDEWDIERAVEQRLVQVMFTVPKERLRVVNAEIEKEEEAIVVDPDKEDYEEHSFHADSEVELRMTRGFGSDTIQEKAEEAAKALLLPEALEQDGEGNLGISPSPSLRTASMTTTTYHTAEAVRLERPRTRVLEMVESIESRSSRDNSPAGSPSR